MQGINVADPSGNGSLNITPTITLAEMAVSEVYGTIQPDIDVKPTEVELNNLPDFHARR